MGRLPSRYEATSRGSEVVGQRVLGAKAQTAIESHWLNRAASDYRKKLEEAGSADVAPPATPTVDLVIAIKNTSDKPVTV